MLGLIELIATTPVFAVGALALTGMALAALIALDFSIAFPRGSQGDDGDDDRGGGLGDGSQTPPSDPTPTLVSAEPKKREYGLAC